MTALPTARRSGRRVALLARYPQRDPAMPQFISNHGMRMVEAALRAAGLEDLEVRVYDLAHNAPLRALLQDLLAFDPDVIGFSAYLWSFPFFIEVASHLKNDDPGRLIVFGGPSARASMLNLEPFQFAKAFIDALVINDGERTFLEIIRLKERDTAALMAIQGLALPAATCWHETPGRPLADLNELPSPYRMGLVPHGGLGVLQTFRGCPFTCSFCEWGVLESPKRVVDVDNLCAELAALGQNEVAGVLLVDAGLNLNRHAFENLRAAADRSGLFAQRPIICEVYPAKVTQEHLDFLAAAGRAHVGVGLQSFDNAVLAHVERNYDEVHFEERIHRLTEVADVAIEIIMGLPGDSPASFRQSFERARKFPCALRVYHCVVLPSALMVRAPAHFRLDFDAYSLKMRSCLGWPAQELQRECDFLTQRAIAEGGQTGTFFWVFPPPRGL